MIRGKFLNGCLDDLSSCFEIRRKVFIEEQNISEEDEFDGLDDRCGHYIVFNEEDQPVSTGRLIFLGDKTYQIGRVSTLKEERHKGYGEFLMLSMIEKARSIGAEKLVILAQVPVVPFYEKCGFVLESKDIIMDTGIEHYKMIYDFSSIRKCCSCH